MKDSERDRGFAQGVAWAIAVLERNFGETSLAENLLGESGIDQKSFRRACDPYDYNIIRRFFARDDRWEREMESRRRAMRPRTLREQAE